MKALIVNADDFGLTAGVNRGILDCFLAGSLSSTTLMVNVSATEEAVEMARQNPALGVGLHFNLTLGRPVCEPDQVKTLVGGDGQFFPRGNLEKRLLLGVVDQADVRREFAAQLKRFLEFGIPLSHIDSHQHIHLFPRVFDVLAEHCISNGLPLRIPWLFYPAGASPGWRKRLRMRVLGRLISRNTGKWGNSLRCNKGFGSVFDLGRPPAELTLDDYRRLLAAVSSSPFELMVHPAHADAELANLTRISAVSQTEWKILSEEGLGGLIAEFGLSLTTYRDAFVRLPT